MSVASAVFALVLGIPIALGDSSGVARETPEEAIKKAFHLEHPFLIAHISPFGAGAWAAAIRDAKGKTLWFCVAGAVPPPLDDADAIAPPTRPPGDHEDEECHGAEPDSVWHRRPLLYVGAERPSRPGAIPLPRGSVRESTFIDLMQSFVDDQIRPTKQERYLDVWLGQRQGGDLTAISPLSARQVNALRVLEMLMWIRTQQDRQPVTRSTRIDK